MDYLQGRWERLPGDDRAASFLLEDLLASQDRLSFAESAFVDAQVAYALSLTRLNRSTGMMLKHEKVQLVRGHDGSASTLSFQPLETTGPASGGELPAPSRGPNPQPNAPQASPPNAPGANPRFAPPANRVGPTAKQPQRPAAPSNPMANQTASPWNNRLANSPPAAPPIAPRGATVMPQAGTRAAAASAYPATSYSGPPTTPPPTNPGYANPGYANPAMTQPPAIPYTASQAETPANNR